MNFQFLEAKTRLIRIMGTFDLATGHADTFDELLDSLESELRDVLGHYREALKQHLTKEPVAMLERDPSIGRLRVTYEDAITELEKGVYPLYIKPPQREWQGLTDEERNACLVEADPCEALLEHEAWQLMVDIEAKLKEKNGGRKYITHEPAPQRQPEPVGWIYEDDEGRMIFSQMPHPDPLWEPVYRAQK